MQLNNTHTTMNVQSNQCHPAEENGSVQLRHSQIESLICWWKSFLLESVSSHTSSLSVGLRSTRMPVIYIQMTDLLLMKAGRVVFHHSPHEPDCSSIHSPVYNECHTIGETVAICLSVRPSVLCLSYSSLICYIRIIYI